MRLCKESLKVAVFGDSNWANGAIRDKLAALDSKSEYLHIAQNGSGKTIPAMMGLDIPKILAEKGFVPDVVLLGAGTNDGRCNGYVTCTPSTENPWCGGSPATVTAVREDLSKLFEQIRSAHPKAIPVTVGPAPTYDSQNGGIWGKGGTCGYTAASKPFMGELSEGFVAKATEFGFPYVDIFHPLIEGSANQEVHPWFGDGVHYVGSAEAVTVVAEEILRVIAEIRGC